MRGEYRVGPSASISCPELPPRARRIQVKYHGHIMDRGTTSACAENTASRIPKYHMTWNYLRVRGEYLIISARCVKNWELPPRARRIRTSSTGQSRLLGTTSACAENTQACSYSGPAKWNYLRVRGEYSPARHSVAQTRELPPRARRIHRPVEFVQVRGGTTSACAENTLSPPSVPQPGRNYLRVRGEY